jgi:hypothetical protein
MSYCHDLCAEPYMAQALHSGIKLLDKVIDLGALRVLINGGIVKVPYGAKRSGVGEVLYSLRSIGKVREYLQAQ